MANHTLLIVGGTLQQGGAERIISVLSEKFLEYFARSPAWQILTTNSTAQ